MCPQKWWKFTLTISLQTVSMCYLNNCWQSCEHIWFHRIKKVRLMFKDNSGLFHGGFEEARTHAEQCIPEQAHYSFPNKHVFLHESFQTLGTTSGTTRLSGCLGVRLWIAFHVACVCVREVVANKMKCLVPASFPNSKNNMTRYTQRGFHQLTLPLDDRDSSCGIMHQVKRNQNFALMLCWEFSVCVCSINYYPCFTCSHSDICMEFYR